MFSLRMLVLLSWNYSSTVYCLFYKGPC